MINSNDYISYIDQNKELLENIKENAILSYGRFEDVLTVLDFIVDRVSKYKKVEEEFEVIFEAGFSYLYDQLENLKTYLFHYFNNDISKLYKFDNIINYALYLEDLVDILKEQKIYKQKVKTELTKVSSRIDEILKNKEEYTENVFEEFDMIVEEFVPVGTLSTSEIYSNIQEELLISF